VTKTEKSLLLYIECRATDHTGTIDSRQINDEERQILEKWHGKKFIVFGRIAFKDIGQKSITNYVVLSDEAWELASKLRRERADRMWGNRTWRTADEYRTS
jgi:hypothetical protein